MCITLQMNNTHTHLSVLAELGQEALLGIDLIIKRDVTHIHTHSMMQAECSHKHTVTPPQPHTITHTHTPIKEEGQRW